MYKEENLVRIAKRENNKKRNYLVINKLQGKHIPVKPKKSFDMFHELAEILQSRYPGEKLFIIGFAETATAIGASVAVRLGAFYIQTTREVIPDVNYIYFSEEHSHATEQKLVQEDIEEMISKVERIIFVEDEVTTGKTILNIIGILKKRYPSMQQYAVASLLNGMDDNARKTYKEQNIPLHYLIKTDHGSYIERAEQFAGDGEYIILNRQKSEIQVKQMEIHPSMNTRRVVDSTLYQKSTEYLYQEIRKQIEVKPAQKILVLGTEEFMYPALYVAKRLEEEGCDVRSHSTTRSPICVDKSANYPLHTRYQMCSFYDPNRVTYLYDLSCYDKVLILTDATAESMSEGRDSLIAALEMVGNKEIYVVRWC